ncbi:CD3337/EF1877 family mobilome membrane protein [Peribacillus frigoritolerans]|uniref:CD3337/EF1877 family mobilome membrane protein n=1 Tax=Peribacillus frigoritolerans TaxID=450367 RepID=UPI0032B34BDD
MKKIQMLCLLLTILFVSIIPSAPASAEDMMDNLLPQETKDKAIYSREGDVILEYNKYPLTRYSMDTKLEDDTLSDLAPWGWDDKVGKETNQGLSVVNSGLWNFNKIIAATTGKVVSEAYNLNFVSTFAKEIATIIQSIAGFGPGGFKSTGLWPYYALSIISIVGAWAAYVGLIKRAANAALSGLLGTVIVMAIGLGFFTHADKILVGINNATSVAQNDILSFSLTATSKGDYENTEGMATMRNQIFNLMVKNPYLLLNFGTTDEEKIENKWEKKGSRVDAMLKNSFYSEKRKNAVKYEVEELKNTNMTPKSLTDRFVILIFVLIANSILSFFLLLMSCSMIFYQIALLVFALFTPVAFLMGMIPAFSATAQNIIMKLLHAGYMKIGLSLLTTLYFTLSSMVYRTMDPKGGYILLFVLQIVCAVVIWIKRNEILNVVSRPFSKANVNNNLGLNVGEYKKSYFKAKKHFNKFTKPFTQKADPRSMAERTGLNKLKFQPGVGAVDVLRHPMYTKQITARQERLTKNNVKQQTASNPKSSAVKHNENVQPNKPKQSNPTAQPTVNNSPKRPIINQTLNDPRNFQSLEQTLEKGGYAHQVKENVQLKEKPAMNDRLAARKIKEQNDNSK